MCTGLSTKVHVAVDGHGRPLAMLVTAGQRHESTRLGPLLDAIRVPRPGGRGRPRKRPTHLVADRGYTYTTWLALATLLTWLPKVSRQTQPS